MGFFVYFSDDKTEYYDSDACALFLSSTEAVEIASNSKKIFDYLICNRNIVLTRRQITSWIDGVDDNSDIDRYQSRAIDVAISELRKKLGKYSDCIKTVRGAGYKYSGPPKVEKTPNKEAPDTQLSNTSLAAAAEKEVPPVDECISSDVGYEDNRDARTQQLLTKGSGENSSSCRGNRKNDISILVKCIVALLLAAVILFPVRVLINTRGTSNTTQKNPEKSMPVENTANSTEDESDTAQMSSPIDGAEETGFIFDPETMYHIVVAPPSSMSVGKFNDAIDILRERVEIFVDGEPFEMKPYPEYVELYLPRTAFADLKVATACDYFLTSEAKFYAVTKNKNAFSLPVDADCVELERSDFEKVTLDYGNIPGVDATEYGITEGSYQYITIILTEECAQEIKNKAWDAGFTLTQTDGSMHTISYSTVTNDSDRILYILDADLEGKFGKLLYYNLTHDELEDDLMYSLMLESNVAWERVEDTTVLGENQCNAEDLTGSTVTIVYSSRYNAEEISDGQRLDLNKGFKERLDGLGQPYAFGSWDGSEYIDFVVKTGLEHMGIPIMELLRCDYFTLKTGLAEKDLYKGLDNVSYTQSSDGYFTVEVEVKDALSLENMTGALASPGDDLFLFAGDTPLFRTKIDRTITDGKVTFTQMCGSEENTIGAEYGWVVKLMEQVWNAPELPTSLVLSLSDLLPSRPYILNAENGVAPLETDFGLYNREYEKIASAVTAICPGAGVKCSGNSIDVWMHLDVDEALATNSTTLIKRIYNEIEFESGFFGHLTFYLIDEANEDFERCRIFFTKQYGGTEGDLDMDSSTFFEGYVYGSGIFTNGRLNKYKDDFKNIIESDDFYIERTRSDHFHIIGGDWTYE